MQKAITPKFLRALHDHFRKPGEPVADSMYSQLVDLYLGFFFFAGRCCEFCFTSRPGRTTRVTVADVEFRDATMTLVVLTEETDLDSLMFVTVRFREQKNKQKSQKRTQGRTNDPVLDPVLRLARAVLRIKRKVEDWNGDTELCTIGRKSNETRISDKLVLETLRMVCRIHGSNGCFGFKPEEIGNKSLRSGAAMAMFLSKKGYGEVAIKFLGRWRSMAFMDYIRPQAMEATSDTAAHMVNHTVTDLSSIDTDGLGNRIAVLRIDY